MKKIVGMPALTKRTVHRFTDPERHNELVQLCGPLAANKDLGSRAAIAFLSDSIEAEWRQAHVGLESRPIEGYPCLCALAGRSHGWDDDVSREECIPLPPFNDHGDAWWLGDKLVLYTCQPYAPVQFDEIYAYAEKWCLSVRVTAKSWHFPTRTFLIELCLSPSVATVQGMVEGVHARLGPGKNSA